MGAYCERVEHARRLAIGWIAWSILVASAATLGTVYFLATSDDRQVAGELFLLSLAQIPGLIGGIGIRSRQAWARPLLFIAGMLSIIAFPIGTALAGYTWWALLRGRA